MRRLIFQTASTLAICGLAASFTWASKDELMKIAVERPVSGWSVAPDSSTYVSGDRLQEIYNGGYEVYTKAGVLEALRKMYSRGDEFVEVTVHTMKSAQAARSFLAERHRMEMGKNAPKAPNWNQFTASGSGSTTGYSVQGRYFITIVSYHEGEKGKQQALEFVKPLEANAAKLTQK